MQADEQEMYIHDLKQEWEALKRINSDQAGVLADLQTQFDSQPCQCTCSQDTPAALDAQQQRIEQLKAACEAKRKLYDGGLVAMAREEERQKPSLPESMTPRLRRKHNMMWKAISCMKPSCRRLTTSCLYKMNQCCHVLRRQHVNVTTTA